MLNMVYITYSYHLPEMQFYFSISPCIDYCILLFVCVFHTLTLGNFFYSLIYDMILVINLCNILVIISYLLKFDFLMKILYHDQIIVG